MAWWFSLLGLVGGLGVAYWLHITGLSLWLKRIDFWHTLGATALALLSLGMFIAVSRGRMQDMRAPTKLLWLLPAFPVWVLFMGLVPGATDAKPEPLKSTIKKLTLLLVTGALVAAGLASLYLWLDLPGIGAVVHDTPSGPESRSMYMSYDKCLLLISRTATQLGVAPINIAETNDLRMVRFVASDGTVLVTCSRLDGKAVITKSD